MTANSLDLATLEALQPKDHKDLLSIMKNTPNIKTEKININTICSVSLMNLGIVSVTMEYAEPVQEIKELLKLLLRLINYLSDMIEYCFIFKTR